MPQFQAYLVTLFRLLGVELAKPGLRAHYWTPPVKLAAEYLYRQARIDMVAYLTDGSGPVAAGGAALPEVLKRALSDLQRNVAIGVVEERLQGPIAAIRREDEQEIQRVEFEWPTTPERAAGLFYETLASGTGAECRTRGRSEIHGGLSIGPAVETAACATT